MYIPNYKTQSMNNPHSTDYNTLLSSLEQLSTPHKKTFLPRYFKTNEGEYGAGDQFIGVSVPDVRGISKSCLHASWELLDELLASEWHEMRLLALLIMVG